MPRKSTKEPKAPKPPKPAKAAKDSKPTEPKKPAAHVSKVDPPEVKIVGRIVAVNSTVKHKEDADGSVKDEAIMRIVLETKMRPALMGSVSELSLDKVTVGISAMQTKLPLKTEPKNAPKVDRETGEVIDDDPLGLNKTDKSKDPGKDKDVDANRHLRIPKPGDAKNAADVAPKKEIPE